MSYEGDFYGGGNVYSQDQSANYEFGQFDYSVHDQTTNTSYGVHHPSSFPPSSQVSSQPSLYNPVAGSMNTDPFYPSDGDPFADEAPLLEELGINFDQIMEKTLAVINPLKSTQPDILRDSDLAGPLVFCLAFGCFLLLSGKVSFGYIYGIGVCGE